MLAKASCEIKTRVVHRKEKNGDTYILERKEQYDPEKKYNRILSTKLIAKIPKGETVPVPTRPKKKHKTDKNNQSSAAMENSPISEDNAAVAAITSADTTSPEAVISISSVATGSTPEGLIKPAILSNADEEEEDDDEADLLSIPAEIDKASRTRTDMMDILDFIGKESGIDDAIYGSSDKRTAQKIISIARFIVASNGAEMPDIVNWQFTHRVPYEYVISEDVYHDLFVSVGLDEGLQQRYFYRRCHTELHSGSALAFDSTTISTYSENLDEARQGFAKDGSSMNVIKLLTLYSLDTRQPVVFTKLPGNNVDVVTIENALRQLEALGVTQAEIITDNGYYSQKNLARICLSQNEFITLCKINIKWVREELIQRLAQFATTTSACPFDEETHGITVSLYREFPNPYIDKDEDKNKAVNKTFTRHIYLHLFFNASRKLKADLLVDKKLIALKEAIENREDYRNFDDTSKAMISSYLTITYNNGTPTVTFKEDKIHDLKRFHGYFAIVASNEKDTFKCLRKYRNRGWLENFFWSAKQDADSTRTRVWSPECLRGRMFVQFVALGYIEFIRQKIANMKSTLGKPNGDSAHDRKSNLEAENKLKNWVKGMSLHAILQWFDVIEEVCVSKRMIEKRWNTESTQRDRLFLSKLGMKLH